MVKWLFVLLFVLPVAAVSYYLFAFSKDQYRSRLAFSVRSETPKTPLDFFSTGTTSADSDILADFIHSREIVDLINEKIDLYEVYRTGEYDPLYYLEDEAQIEDLTLFWERMVNIFHERSSGIIQVEVFAFTPESTLAIAEEIIINSYDLINRISNISEDDKLSHVRTELALALSELRNTQQELTRFRSEFQVVDPDANFQTQIELIKSLQEKYIDSTIELELMRDILNDEDIRMKQAQRKVRVLSNNITIEREKIGAKGQPSPEDMVSIFDRYEKLSINLDLARELYSESRRSYAAVLSKTKLKDKYLAVHVEPKMPEASKFPRRPLIFTLSILFFLMVWFSSSLVYYSIRDRN